MRPERGAKAVDFLWLGLPLALLAAFREGAEPAGLAVGFSVYFVGPLLGGLIMLERAAPSAPGCWSRRSFRSSATSRSSGSQAGASTCLPSTQA